MTNPAAFSAVCPPSSAGASDRHSSQEWDRPPAGTPARRSAPQARVLGALVVALLVTACGGGGGGGGGSADGGSVASGSSDGGGVGDPGSGAPATRPLPPLDSGHVPIGSLTTFARAAVDGINAIRATPRACDRTQPTQISPAVDAIGWNTKLQASAFAHSKDLQANNKVDHLGSNGSTVGQRATAQGYVWDLAGENLAAGYDSLDTVLHYWTSSAAHCRVLMTADFAEIGLAVVAGATGNTWSNFWTLDLARAR